MSKKSEELFTGQAHRDHVAESAKFKDDKQRDRVVGCATLISQHLGNARNSTDQGFGVEYDRGASTLADALLMAMGQPPAGAVPVGYVLCRTCVENGIHELEEATAAFRDLLEMIPKEGA